ncbi:reverse transcriptase [Ancylostoma ceylanicum]|uniref:Reverse transcriptase n=1 Tax=Ancylostoma ceylanicum TaxID=53326 RepID=A0A0D6LUB8_9BILA|nr:reverse transcriptase [Ancylostoma ceylanicum]
MDEEMIETVAAKETFEMVDDVNEDYTRRVGTIIKIRNECRAETQNHASRRISSSTRALLEKRRHMDRQANHVEYAVLNRLCRQRLPEDHANFVRSRLLDAAHSKRSLKMGKRTEHRLSILCLKAPDGSRCSSRPEMENIMANFYTALYKSDSGQTAVLSPGEEVPPFVTSEVRHAIEIMPRGKAPAVDGITVELLQACVPTLYTALARHFSLCQAKCEVPAAWKQSSTILLFKKGDKEDLENYRPITLLPVLYKVFTRCIMTAFGEHWMKPSRYSKQDFGAIAREYQEPLVLTFIDYKKAFDSVEPAEVWKAPEEQGVEARYTKVLRKCYSGYTIVFRPFLNDIEVSVEKGVRQGDPASPNLFSACLESVIRNCDWSSFGVLIDEERLNRLRFADDIVLITRMPLKCFDGQMKKEAKQALPSTRPRPRESKKPSERVPNGR